MHAGSSRWCLPELTVGRAREFHERIRSFVLNESGSRPGVGLTISPPDVAGGGSAVARAMIDGRSYAVAHALQQAVEEQRVRLARVGAPEQDEVGLLSEDR